MTVRDLKDFVMSIPDTDNDLHVIGFERVWRVDQVAGVTYMFVDDRYGRNSGEIVFDRIENM